MIFELACGLNLGTVCSNHGILGRAFLPRAWGVAMGSNIARFVVLMVMSMLAGAMSGVWNSTSRATNPND
jgi:hypothetical protein